MEYIFEDSSPAKKKIKVTLASSEIDAKIEEYVAMRKSGAQVPGFRKGKAPSSIVEKHFHDTIYADALNSLIRKNMGEIFEKEKLEPLSDVQISGLDTPLERHKAYEYAINFEIMPQIELPPYDGLTVEEEKSAVTEDGLELAYKQFIEAHSKYVPAEGNGPAKDGQLVIVDLQTFKDGKPVEDMSSTNFECKIGAHEALPDFENLVKGIPLGHTGEGVIHIPENFLIKKYAGKELTMKVTVNAIKDMRIPEFDDKLAKSIGYDNVGKIKENIRKNMEKSLLNIHRGVAQKKLLDQLVKLADIPLPHYLVNNEIIALISSYQRSLEYAGSNLQESDSKIETLIEKFRPQAEDFARCQILLYNIAKKENLTVSKEEIDEEIDKIAERTKKASNEVYFEMSQDGRLKKIEHKLLSDKAMDLLYGRANIVYVDKLSDEEEQKPVDAVETDLSKEDNSSSSPA